MPNRQRRKPATQLARFFTSYQRFDYDPTAPVSTEFYRLTRTYKWKRGSPARQQAWEGFSEAMGRQFSTFYGTDVDDLDAWQALCIALEVDPVPDTVHECKIVIKSKHVNLVDFIDTRLTGEAIQIFETEEQLRTYTKETHKFFPLDSAKESGVLRYLLREILR